MKKFVVSIAVFLSALAALAAENVTPAACVWTGAASSEWDNAGNWMDGVKPGKSDVAVFRSDASVSPPDTFDGVLQLEGPVTVTATVSAPAGFALRSVSSSAGAPSFVKRGSAVLKLRPCRGMNRGMVTVAEGSVDFSSAWMPPVRLMSWSSAPVHRRGLWILRLRRVMVLQSKLGSCRSMPTAYLRDSAVSTMAVPMPTIISQGIWPKRGTSRKPLPIGWSICGIPIFR